MLTFHCYGHAGVSCLSAWWRQRLSILADVLVVCERWYTWYTFSLCTRWHQFSIDSTAPKLFQRLFRPPAPSLLHRFLNVQDQAAARWSPAKGPHHQPPKQPKQRTRPSGVASFGWGRDLPRKGTLRSVPPFLSSLSFDVMLLVSRFFQCRFFLSPPFFWYCFSCHFFVVFF